PGSHVDIIHTTRDGNGNTVSKVLLEDVIVLAADSSDQRPEAGAIMASVVTVALNPDDMLKVAQAGPTGTLSLALRTPAARRTPRATTPGEDGGEAPPAPRKPSGPAKKHPTPPEGPPVVAKEKKVLPNGLRKFTQTIHNGEETKVVHYWIDANGNVV